MTSVQDAADVVAEAVDGADSGGSWVQPVPDLVDPLGLSGSVAGRWIGVPVNGVAFVLQAMHPVIGDVVDRYSVYDSDPVGRAVRSFDAVLQWFYGGKAAIEQGYWLRRMHQPLQMTNAEGKHISGLHPQAYTWVVATAFASAVWSAPVVLGRKYTDAEEEQIFQEIRTVARNLQVPEKEFPASRADYWVYYDNMVSQVLQNHTVAKNIMHTFRADPPIPPQVPAALSPVVRPAMKAGMHVSYLLFAGVMPPEIREMLNIRWGRFDELQLRMLGRIIRLTHQLLPERLTFAPLAYHTRKQQRIINNMRERELTDFTAHDKQRYAAACPL